MTELLTPEQAAARIAPGSRIGLGGLQGNFPMATIRALARGGARELDVVGPPVGMAGELLVAAGAVRSLAAPYMGAEGVIPVAPAFRAEVQAGRLELWECDEAILLQALRAAAQDLPYLPWRGGVGTDLPRLNPALVPYIDAPSGTLLLRVPALRLDVAILHALEADTRGNVRYHEHSAFADPALARAADRVFVEVERLVDHELVLREPQRTVHHRVDALILAPLGSHPFRAAGVLDQDDAWLREWAAGIRETVREGGRPADAEVLARELRAVNHEQYLELVGRSRLDGLLLDPTPGLG
jgi:glutaconate CoA-transferase, subunit A